MKLLVEVKNSKAAFFLELLRNLPFIKANPFTPEDAKILDEIKHDIEDEERKDWTKIAMQSLNRAYADDEPDYKDISVQEPNPEYNPWKQDQ